MAVVIDGTNNVITGISAGGYPSGSITNANLNGQCVTASILNSGQVVQMVNTTLSSTVSIAANGGAITGLSVSITPQFTSSRIYITMSIMFGFGTLDMFIVL